MNKEKIAIVTDYSSLSEKDIEEEKLKHVYTLPLYIIEDSKTYKCTEENFEKEDIFNKIIENKIKLTTSKTNNFDATSTFDKLIKKYDEIICILINSKISSQYESIVNIVQNNKEYKNKITVLNTCTGSYGILILIKKILELIEKTKNKKELFQKIKMYERKQILNFIIPGDLKRLIKGGRSKEFFLTRIINLFKIKMIFSLNRKTPGIQMVGFDRTYKKILEKMKKIVKKELKNHSKADIYFLMSKNNKMRDFCKNLFNDIKNIKVYIKKLEPILYIHGGANSISICLQFYAKNNNY